MKKEYVCECGKIYHTPSALGGHQRSCYKHYQAMGKQDEFESIKKARKEKSSRSLKIYNENRRKKELDEWISEKHICEKCGKVMTEKYGPGRFCSASCAHSRIRTDDIKIKVSETLRKRTLTEEEKEKLLYGKAKNKKLIYKGPALPEIKIEKLKPGFFSRRRMSYAEKFWGQVLKNNNVQFKHEVVIQKPKGGQGVYRLDFLVDKVDIEIDGSFHFQEATYNKDIIRDNYLKSLGYSVYRIPWINPYNDKNKLLVNKQIQDLFQFLNKPRIV